MSDDKTGRFLYHVDYNRMEVKEVSWEEYLARMPGIFFTTRGLALGILKKDIEETVQEQGGSDGRD